LFANVLNLVFGVDAIVGELANTSVGFYLYPREIKKISEGFVLYLYQPDRKQGKLGIVSILTRSALERFVLDMLSKSDYLLLYSFIA
jgi:hypothetical protein